MPDPRAQATPMTEPDDGWDDYDADGERDCSRCGGEPWAAECADPLQCGCDGWHCIACADTGLAKFQVFW